MVNELINARDLFSAAHPEKFHTVQSRKWGAISVGDQGPALLLLPGTLGRADIFWNQITALGGQVRILALSYPETGTILEWCDDIIALMEQYNMDKATVLGSSLGGYVAQVFAGLHPDKTDALIAANTLHSVAILADMPPYNGDIDGQPAQDLMQGFMDGLTQWAQEDPARADLVELLVQEVTGRIPIGQLRNRIKVLKEGPELPPISLNSAHIFTVESDDDRLIPAPVRAAVRARLDPARAKVFPQGSHFPYVTHPDEYSAMIADILALTPSKGASK